MLSSFHKIQSFVNMMKSVNNTAEKEVKLDSDNTAILTDGLAADVAKPFYKNLQKSIFTYVSWLFLQCIFITCVVCLMLIYGFLCFVLYCVFFSLPLFFYQVAVHIDVTV